MGVRTIEGVLELAIEQEVEAARTYRHLAERVGRDDLKAVLHDLANQEDAHRASLEQVRSGDLEVFARTWPERDALVFPPKTPSIRPDSRPQEVILTAMEAERRAFLLYTSMAEEAEDAGIKTILGAIAREETHHWESLEKIYDSLTGLERPEGGSADG